MMIVPDQCDNSADDGYDVGKKHGHYRGDIGAVHEAESSSSFLLMKMQAPKTMPIMLTNSLLLVDIDEDAAAEDDTGYADIDVRDGAWHHHNSKQCA